MKQLCIILLIPLLHLSVKGHAQVLHEIGITAGPVAITTDYGERGDFRNFYYNTGIGIGLQHYMNFVFTGNNTRTNYFRDFFRIRTDLNYFQSELDHYGPISYQNDPRGELLRAMHGKTSILEFGSQLEWHFTQIREYLIFSSRFSPYITAGVHLAYFMPEAYSELGPLDSPGVLFPSFKDGVNMEDGITAALVFGGGTRYRLARNSDLVLEIKWQFYGSDYIEGLDVKGQQNQSNDWLIWLNVGYIYYLDF